MPVYQDSYQRETIWNFQLYIHLFAFLSEKKNTQTEWSSWVLILMNASIGI